MASQPVPRRLPREMEGMGKVIFGAGCAAILSWLATSASTAGQVTHFKVWTAWSVALVVVAGVLVISGVVWWRPWKRAADPRPDIHMHFSAEAQVTINGEVGTLQANVTPTAPTAVVPGSPAHLRLLLRSLGEAPPGLPPPPP